MIGLSTYAYFWRSSARVDDPLTLEAMMRDCASQGIRLFQICDFAAVEALDERGLAGLRSLAVDLGLTLEVGTRGTAPAVLDSYLRIAVALGAGLVRSMWTAGEDRPDGTETERRLRAALPAYEHAGVTLALETYEQVPTSELVAVVEAVGSAHLGICLDPANTVANMERPSDVTLACSPYVANWHVKDFDFVRQPGWVGFSLVGVPLGEGRLDYDGMLDALQPAERGINQVVEHWLPWQGDSDTTTRLEAEWTTTTIDHMRSRNNE